MGVKKKVRKFAQVKRAITLRDCRLNPQEPEKDKKKDDNVVREIPQVSSSLFFQYNTALTPPYSVLVDTNFLSHSVQHKLEVIPTMMDCLYAKCTPVITDCVLAELEKLGQKYRLALRIAKDPRKIPGVPIMNVARGNTQRRAQPATNPSYGLRAAIQPREARRKASHRECKRTNETTSANSSNTANAANNEAANKQSVQTRPPALLYVDPITHLSKRTKSVPILAPIVHQSSHQFHKSIALILAPSTYESTPIRLVLASILVLTGK
uniref:rRNA-processing protein FCF1 n=1 Tax=Talaromyces marneffei PM1 TaxID=1077442 RepID=A0A093V414_TALMA